MDRLDKRREGRAIHETDHVGNQEYDYTVPNGDAACEPTCCLRRSFCCDQIILSCCEYSDGDAEGPISASLQDLSPVLLRDVIVGSMLNVGTPGAMKRGEAVEIRVGENRRGETERLAAEGNLRAPLVGESIRSSA